MKKEIERIQTLSTLFGPSGKEDKVSEYVMEQCQDFCTCSSDSMRNTFLFPKNQKPHTTKILLDAHADEVGFIVQAIKPNGTLRFLPLGGWDAKNVAASSVWIENLDGELVEGIVASQPVHFMDASDKNKALSFDDLVIDIGACSQKEVIEDYRISIGAFCCPAVECAYNDRKEIFMGKAFDCRIGVAALMQVLDNCKNKSLNHTLSAVISSQEEVGDRGSSLAVQNIDADLAICFEGCPADDSFEAEYMIQSGLKRGPMIRHFDRSMITNPRYMRYVIDLAHQFNIPVQESVRKGGGTNGGVYHIHSIPTVVIGIPVRFAHAPKGICSLEDYKNAVALATAIIENIDEETIRQF